ncbi:DNA repair protein rad14 [Mycoemilia scoparia]|uniref:DNA repair protein rad14 n=1 Tax=Mycoemilia scoparia TaxID=417184 RepID=A0A9W8ACP4_9FUNG|nr:DNA repair protein rad14 [Mycoemilia scoparia]
MDESELTPAQLRRIEENRQRALARRKRQESEGTNSVQAPIVEKKAKRSRLSSGYYEYNLTTMKDSKGGFMVNESSDIAAVAAAASMLSARGIKQQEIPENLPHYINPDDNPKCRECKSIDVDARYLNIYGISVCSKCKEEYPEKYSLLTKTEVKEDYLLTDSELMDHKVLPCWEKPNPHKTTWNNMLLFLREQVEAFAINKWGSLEALDNEFERREAEKKIRKEKRFKKSLLELRRRTRLEELEKKSALKKANGTIHEHDFVDANSSIEPDLKKCRTCGIETIIEEL